VALAFVSCIVNLFWVYPYSLNDYVSRFGYKFDSLMKFFYLLLSYFAFILSVNAFSANNEKCTRNLINGSLLAAGYCWYLFFSGLISLDPILLPGMDDDPQMMSLSDKGFIRCGTMKEGNYMGMFLFLVAVIVTYKKKYKQAIFLFVTTITTFSTIAIGCSFLFSVAYIFKKYVAVSNYRQLFKYSLALALFLGLILSVEEFRFVLLEKVLVDSRDIDRTNAALSKADRLNSVDAALEIGSDNPYFGVGLSNYALHYLEYYPDMLFYRVGFKNIINNVYAEVFAELGLIAFFLYSIILFYLYMYTKYDKTGAITIGYCLSLVYFSTFPSFTILYIWVFWGFIASLKYKNEQEETAS
jgi:hypothetical protein